MNQPGERLEYDVAQETGWGQDAGASHVDAAPHGGVSQFADLPRRARRSCAKLDDARAIARIEQARRKLQARVTRWMRIYGGPVPDASSSGTAMVAALRRQAALYSAATAFVGRESTRNRDLHAVPLRGRLYSESTGEHWERVVGYVPSPRRPFSRPVLRSSRPRSSRTRRVSQVNAKAAGPPGSDDGPPPPRPPDSHPNDNGGAR